MSSISKYHISWDQFHSDAIKLSSIIKDAHQNIKGIVCITRGGLAPTAIISSCLEIKKIEVFSIVSYDNNNNLSKDRQIITEPLEALKDLGKDWLVIDELVDSASTLEFVRKLLPKSYIYTLYSKVVEHRDLNGYLKHYDKGLWLVFPWEKE
jgi:xanthine phosphoribosyltransferase